MAEAEDDRPNSSGIAMLLSLPSNWSEGREFSELSWMKKSNRSSRAADPESL
jgi:hypothetical protein